MSATSDCTPCCPSPVVTSTPGTAGESAFSTLVLGITVPNQGDTQSMTLTNTGWIVLGMIVTLDGPYNFLVTSVDYNANTIVGEFLDYVNDGASGTSVPAGTKIVVGGPKGPSLANPLAIANGGTGAENLADAQANLGATPWAIGYGGTGAATKAAAQTALGLGQDPLISTVTGLAQAVTASATQVAGSDVTIPAAGNWLVYGSCAITITGATFAASRTVTLKVRNTTQGVDVVSTTVKTCIASTTGDMEIVIPPVNYSGGSVNDHLQVFVTVSVINTSGTFLAASATLCAVPLRKS